MIKRLCWFTKVYTKSPSLGRVIKTDLHTDGRLIVESKYVNNIKWLGLVY